MYQHKRRVEARPLTWKDLSESQRRAVKEVSGLLLDAINELPAEPRQAESHQNAHPFLDEQRWSQLAFIDGDRGTGKSSILLTVQRLTAEQAYAGDLPEAAHHLRNRRNRIAWLEPLDMEPLSRGTNLFAAILARIAQELERNRTKTIGTQPRWHDATSAFNAQSLLHQLQTDVSLVWDRLEGEMHGSDPDHRAIWVTDAEKAGLSLNRRMGQMLNAIAQEISGDSLTNPLFVLPVDDFDLAPGHCLELLRLIRMLATPRLFFLIAGNTRIAEAVLKLRSEGELRKLAHLGGASGDLLLRQSVVEIATNNMRKLVPPGQRTRLAELSLTEALTIGDGTKEGTLAARLEKVQFQANQSSLPSMSLARFLGTGARPAMSTNWLCGTPRQVLDCADIFGQLASDSLAEGATTTPRSDEHQHALNDRLVGATLNEVKRQIQEDWRIAPNRKHKLAKMFDTSGAISVDMKETVSIETTGDRHVLPITFEHGNISLKTATIMRMGYKNSNGGRTILPQRVTAGLIFAHDLSVSVWGGYLRHSPLTYSTDTGPTIETQWRLPDNEWINIPWIKPSWWTFRDVERFSSHWELHSEHCREDYGTAWLASILEVVLDEQCIPGLLGLSNARLADFLDRIVDEEARHGLRTARKVLLQSTILSCATLLSPETESGLIFTEICTNKLGKRLRDHGTQEQIRRTRAQFHPLALGHDLLDSTEISALSAAIGLQEQDTAQTWSELCETFRTEKAKAQRSQAGKSAIQPQRCPTKNSPNPVKFLEELLKDKQLMERSDGLHRHATALWRIEMMARHPFNTFDNGSLVPRASDIDAARRTRR